MNSSRDLLVSIAALHLVGFLPLAGLFNLEEGLVGSTICKEACGERRGGNCGLWTIVDPGGEYESEVRDLRGF